MTERVLDLAEIDPLIRYRFGKMDIRVSALSPYEPWKVTQSAMPERSDYWTRRQVRSLVVTNV